MEYELHELTAAVRALAESDWYDSPLLISSLGTLIGVFAGAGITHLTFTKQEFKKVETEKIRTVNKWLLIFTERLNGLIAMKRNYSKRIQNSKFPTEPLSRATLVPIILINSKMIENEIDDLVFISEKEDCKHKEKNKSKLNGINWQQLSYISLLKSNYNVLLSFWNTRNKNLEELINKYGGELELSDLYSKDRPACQGLIELTETVITLTDELIVSINDFLTTFPSIAKTRINNKILKDNDMFLGKSKDDTSEFQESLVRLINADKGRLGQLINRSMEEIEEMQKPLFNILDKSNEK